MPICAYYQRHHIYRTTEYVEEKHTKCLCVMHMCYVRVRKCECEKENRMSDGESERECSRHTFKAAPHITQQSGFKLHYIGAILQEPFGTISTDDDSRHSIDFHSWCQCQIVQMSSQNGLEISLSLSLSFFLTLNFWRYSKGWRLESISTVSLSLVLALR